MYQDKDFPDEDIFHERQWIRIEDWKGLIQIFIP